jgi:DNA mismatch repair protein MutL
MNEEDALLSFERFATSKIQNADDLENLHTLGFRGEALASIASVAQVELKTKRREDELASVVKIEGGTFTETSKTQIADGTSMAVRNLFYNIPARRKFLKSDATEFKHIYETIQAQSLVYPDIQWTFISDNEEVFRLVTPNIPDRLDHFFGKDFSKGLVEFKEQNDFMTLSGYLGKPAMMKRTKNEQFLFINNRITQSRMLNHAISQAYGQLLGEREHPFYLMYMTIEPKRVDVNVHPSKMEVRFDDERNVYSMVQSVVRKAMSGMDFSPSVKVEEKPDYLSFTALPQQADTRQSPTALGTSKRLSYDDRNSDFRSSNSLYADFKDNLRLDQTYQAVEKQITKLVEQRTFEEDNQSFQVTDIEQKKSTEYQVIYRADEKEEQEEKRWLWQLHSKYILTQIKSGLMLIDQHVAHERILYERAMAVMNAGIPNSQQLLFPQRIELKAWEYEILLSITDDLEKLGFSLRVFGGRSVLIEGIPPDVRPGSEEKILNELIEQYHSYSEDISIEKRHHVAASYACRSSIMAGDKLSQREMGVLIDQLFATTMPYVCPHGRPIIIKVSLGELDKMFGRT